MKQKMRSLGKKLELATYARDKLFMFRLASKLGTADQPGEAVCIPIPIMYRYLHIGRAYDLHQLKNLHPDHSGSVYFVEMQLLILELEQVSELVDDTVLQHYGNLLVTYLKSARTDTKDRLIFGTV